MAPILPQLVDASCSEMQFEAQQNPQLLSIVVKGVNEVPPKSCGKLGGVNAEKRRFGRDMECLFWLNGGHSSKAGSFWGTANPSV
jgi:hypothetical protein